jgi:hypothetical protein
VVVRSAAFDYTKGSPDSWRVELADGRVKGALYCARCKTTLGGPSRFDNLTGVDGGTFDDTSWLVPAGHIWARSAQPWIRLPEGSPQFPKAPAQEEFLAIVRAWKESPASVS